MASKPPEAHDDRDHAMSSATPPLAERLLAELTDGDLRVARRLADTASVGACEEAVEPLARETLRRLQVGPRQASEMSRLISRLADRSTSRRVRARAAWIRGHVQGNLLQHREAQESYREAARLYRRAGDAHHAALVALGQVNVLRHLGADRRALALGERARATLLRHGDRAAALRMDVNLASIHHRHERWNDAVRLYDRALRLARRDGLDAMERVVQFNRGNALVRLGRLDRGRAVFLELRAQLVDGDEPRMLASVEQALGALALRRGELDDAYRHLDAARSIFEELDDPHFLLQTLLELGTLLLETSSHTRAAAVAEQALERARRVGMRREEAQALLLLGVARLGEGAPLEAERTLREARDRLQRIGQPASVALCRLHLAEASRRRGHFGRAARDLEKAARDLQVEGAALLEATARLRQGQLAWERDRLDEAQDALTAAQRLLRRVPSRWLQVQCGHLGACIARRRGRRGLALRRARTAARRLEDVRRRITFDELRVRFAEDRAAVIAEAQQLLLERGRPTDLDEAFALLESSRVWEGPLVDLPAAPVSSAREQSMRARVDVLAAELDALLGISGRGLVAASPRVGRRRIPAEIRRREDELADLHQRLDRIVQRRRRGAARPPFPGLQAIADRVADDEIVVSYLTAPEPSTPAARDVDRSAGTWAFLLRRGDVRCVRLAVDRSELDQLLGELRFQLGKRSFGPDYRREHDARLRDRLDRILSTLAAKIWDPLEIDRRRVWLLAHGPLHAIPFGALPLSDAERVIDRHLLTRIPALASLHRSERRAPKDRAADGAHLIVGIDDPDLPALGEEIEEVRAALDGATVLRGSKATRAAFRERARGADLIHLATHGLHRADDPWFSALRLADGWMSLHELQRLELRARLVTLSACDTGPVRGEGGEELLGLLDGFLRSGARHLVVSLWPVEDQATRELMRVFYRRLRGGARTAEALREAQRDVARRRPDPFDWAGFVLVSSQPESVPMYQDGGTGVC